MKTNPLPKKLIISKKVIARLTDTQLERMAGGKKTAPPTTTQPDSITCQSCISCPPPPTKE